MLGSKGFLLFVQSPTLSVEHCANDNYDPYSLSLYLNFSLLATADTTAANDDVGSQLTEVQAMSPPTDIPAVVFVCSLTAFLCVVTSCVIPLNLLPSSTPTPLYILFCHVSCGSCSSWNVLPS